MVIKTAIVAVANEYVVLTFERMMDRTMRGHFKKFLRSDMSCYVWLITLGSSSCTFYKRSVL